MDKSIRPITLADLEVYRQFIEALSPQTKYQRTLGGAVNPTEEQLRRLLSPVKGQEAAFGVFQGELLLAVGRYAQTQDELWIKHRKVAEFAVTVADAWQGHGIGTTLLKKLKIEAAKEGYLTLAAVICATNPGMLHLAKAQGFEVESVPGDAGIRSVYCSLVEVRSLLNAATPSITPTTSKAIPTTLIQPGQLDRHKYA
jgi:GNAT superfamily N-acetyltransferase